MLERHSLLYHQNGGRKLLKMTAETKQLIEDAQSLTKATMGTPAYPVAQSIERIAKKLGEHEEAIARVSNEIGEHLNS